MLYRSTHFQPWGYASSQEFWPKELYWFDDGRPLDRFELIKEQPPDGSVEIGDVPTRCDEWLAWIGSPTGQELAEHKPNLVVKIVRDGLQSLIDVVAVSCPLPEGIPLRVGHQKIKDARQILMRLREATKKQPQEPPKPEDRSDEPPRPPKPLVSHSDDFRSLNWYGTEYGTDYPPFTPMQAACIGVLFKAWQGGSPVVGQASILEAADSNCSRLRDVFNKGKHPAWGTLIVSPRKGAFRLAEPKKP